MASRPKYTNGIEIGTLSTADTGNCIFKELGFIFSTNVAVFI